ncbi:MAG: TauD/TfdA family dioxygenase [Halieaceae bacterium]|jgi:taurine dioxygenase|nr:TauD/TfdA family dioxygenase [Halieaceae bacterium]
MSIEIRPLDNVGIEVTGFDISQPIDEDTAATLVELFDEHGILVFRGQDVTPERQIAFSRIFGELEKHPIEETRSQDYPELFMLASNPDAEKYMTAYYNGELVVSRLDWHMDLHYTGKPNRGALLTAVVCAEEDGLTGFGDLARAYDALDADTQALLERIRVTYAFSMQRRHMRYVKLDGYQPGEYSPRKPSDINYPNFPEVSYPAVVTHPVTGRKVLEIVEQFLERIVAPHEAGLSNDEAIELLERLVEHTRKPEFHYFHEWQPGDMVLWDNWRAMHCATGTRPGVERVIHRTTIMGDVTLGEVVSA